MTVDEAIKILQDIRDSEIGGGKLPVQYLSADDGITYAQDVNLVRSQGYDGGRVWVYERGVKHSPEWTKGWFLDYL